MQVTILPLASCKQVVIPVILRQSFDIGLHFKELIYIYGIICCTASINMSDRVCFACTGSVPVSLG